VILGCTELPLVLPQHPAYAIGDGTVALLDPTDILARRCVALSLAAKLSLQAGVDQALRCSGHPVRSNASGPAREQLTNNSVDGAILADDVRDGGNQLQ
jgi:hypothetical protein